MTTKVAALLAAVLAALIVGPLAALGGAWYGKSLGRTLESGAQAQQSVQQLNTLIGTASELVAKANNANATMRRLLGQRQQQDNQTSREMRDALNPTANSRAGCVFGADVMRQLDNARARAAAAAASGIRGELSSANANTSGQP